MAFTAISPGVDLNSLTRPGFYGVIDATTALTLGNTPITDAGFTLTIQNKGGTVVQIATSGYDFYMCDQSSNGFNAWKKLALYSDVTNVTTYTRTLTLTTNSNGAFALNSYFSDSNKVLSAKVNGGYRIAMLMYESGWWVSVYQWPDLSKVTNTEVSITFYYQ